MTPERRAAETAQEAAQPWIKWDGNNPPDYIHLIKYELLLKSGAVRFCDIGQPVMWENFGSGSDITHWRPYSSGQIGRSQ